MHSSERVDQLRGQGDDVMQGDECMHTEQRHFAPGDYSLGRALSDIALAEADRRAALQTRVRALELVNSERDRQEQLWGVQTHPPILWVGILGEEYGEFCQAVNETVFDNGPEQRKKGGNDNMIREACHVAAVAVSIIECLLSLSAE